MPIGTIVAYKPPGGKVNLEQGPHDSVSTAPTGWAYCDGRNGTPDLRGRFILGAGMPNKRNNSNNSNSWSGDGANAGYPSSHNFRVGLKSGSSTHTLTLNQIPSHRHGDGSRDKCIGTACQSNGGAAGYSNRGATLYAGGGQSHNNMPPYYVLTYIMKIS